MIRFEKPWRCAVVGILSVMVLVACTHAPPQPVAPPEPITAPEPDPKPAPQSVVPVWSEAHQLAELLERAEYALQQDRLLYPEDDAAFTYYRDVLRRDPNNPIAHAGMQRITQRYFELAEAHWRAGNLDEAQRMLERAQQVAATPEQVARIKRAWPAPIKRNNVFALKSDDLSARSESILERLRQIAEKAEDKDSRLLIVARNDAEGRWIYQTMREAVSDYRLRGNIEIGGNPRVVLIDWVEE